MSSIANQQDNPILVFSDVNPDVFKLTQIYDPDNDKYVKTLDDEHTYSKTKEYFTRIVNNNRVTFEKNGVIAKPDETNNPAANGWYEVNEGHVSQAGTYVPAVGSVVVVNKRTDEYREFTLLTVAAVDDEIEYDENNNIVRYPTYKSTLVPVNFGTGDEISARAIDYGNDKLYLYMQNVTVDVPDGKGGTTQRTVVGLYPDRKLLLLGQRYYMYRITRIKDGLPIAAKGPDSDSTAIPYISAAATEVTVTEENYDSLVGHYLDIIEDNGVSRVLVSRNGDEFFPTQDPSFDSRSVYFRRIADNQYTDWSIWGSREDGLKIITGVDGHRYLKFGSGEIDDEVFSFFEPTTDTTAVVGGDYWVYYKGGWKFVTVVNTEEDKNASIAQGFDRNLILYKGETLSRGGTVHCSHHVVGATMLPGGLYENTAKESILGKSGYIHSDDRSTLECIYYPNSSFLHDGYKLVDGEVVNFEVYEYGTGREGEREALSARMVMNVKLTVKTATPLSTVDVQTKYITGFDVINTDKSSKDKDVWYLLETEKANDLEIYGELTFEDGSKTKIPVDNVSCFKYGLERIPQDAKDENPNRKGNMIIGREYPLLFKFFPKNNQGLGASGVRDFLKCHKTLKIVNTAAATIRKISMLPVWDKDTSRYRMFFLVYRTDFEQPEIIAQQDGSPSASFYVDNEGDRQVLLDNISFLNSGIETGVLYTTAMSKFGAVMHGHITMTAEFAGYKTAVYDQSIAFVLHNWSDAAAPAQKWLIGTDTGSWDEDSLPYGTNYNNGIRPFIIYDDSDASDVKWQIPVKYFASPERFIENFYTRAIDGITATAGMRPTHFRIRSIAEKNGMGKHIQTDPIEISSNGDRFNYTRPIAATEFPVTKNSYELIGGAKPVIIGEITKYMGTVIVEFLLKENDNDYRYLYGVPVETRRYNW